MKAGAYLIFAMIACAVTSAAEATAQFPDQIVIDGKTEMLFAEPLQAALQADHALQRNLMRRISKDRCTASWRGYVATWEIRANQLYLVALRVDPCADRKMVPLAELFSKAPVKATWFSGTLTVPQGKQIEYAHMGYESRYERYLFLDIDKGKVKTRTLTSGSPKSGWSNPGTAVSNNE